MDAVEVVLVAVLAGLVFVVHDVPWVLDQPFWHDESWVAASTRVPLTDLPDATYTTPIGFSSLMRAVAWGAEQRYRLLPLAFSAGSVIAAYCLARLLVWRDRRQAVLAGVLAGGAALLVPSALERNDLKQYTAEAFVALTVLALTANVERRWTRRSLVALAAVVVVAKLISHTVVFVGAAVFLSLAAVAAAEHGWKRAREVIVVGAASAFGMLAIYLAFDRPGASAELEPPLAPTWAGSFPPTDQGLGGVVDYLVERYDQVQALPGLGSLWLSSTLALAGLVTFVLARRRAVALTLPLLLIALVIAGLAERYPVLNWRTSHFLFVILAVVAAVGVAGISAVARRFTFAASLAVAAVAVAFYLDQAEPHLRARTLPGSNVRSQVSFLAAHKHPGDVILVNVRGIYSFAYYWRDDRPRFTRNPRSKPALGIEYPASARIVDVPASTHADVTASLQRARRMALGGSGRVWIVREFWALSAEPAIWQRALRGLTVLEMAGGGAPILVPAFTAEQHGQVELESRAGRLAIRPWLGREIAVTPGVVNGSVDVVSASGGGLSVKGWAADTDRRLVADWVLVFSGDRLLAAAVAAGERPDLERAYDERVRFAGYTATARTRRPGRLAARARLRVFAVLGERASELTVGEGARAALARLASG